jgi:hypothetical protein
MPPTVPNLSMGNVIARRVYTRVKGRSSVVIEIGTPQLLHGEWDCWGCPVRITGLGASSRTPRTILAEDAVQSLELALQYVRATLLPVADELSWVGPPGELFLPFSVPGYLPVAAQKRIERSINQEARRVIDARRRTRSRAKPARGTNPLG